jgi:serine/threonine protein phosphatase PrpC
MGAIVFLTKKLGVLRKFQPGKEKMNLRLLTNFINGGWKINTADLDRPDKIQEIRGIFTKLKNVPELSDAATQALAKLEESVTTLKGNLGPSPEPISPLPRPKAIEVRPSLKDLSKEKPAAPPPFTPSKITTIANIDDLASPDIAVAKKAFNRIITLDQYPTPARMLLLADRWNVKGGELVDLYNQLLDNVRDKSHLKIITNLQGGTIASKDGLSGGVSNKMDRSQNEDSCAIYEYLGKKYLIVTDGAGGHSGGEIASRVALLSALAELEQKPENLTDAINAAQKAVLDILTKEQGDRPASTIVIAMVEGKNVTIAHVGDSPACKIKENGEFELLTYPHSQHALVLSIKGDIDKDALPLPAETMHKLIDLPNSPLMHSLGGDLPSPIQIFKFKLEPGEKLLLASDGADPLLRNANTNRATLETLNNTAERRLAGRISHLARLLQNAIPSGKDNFTALVLEQPAELGGKKTVAQPSGALAKAAKLADEKVLDEAVTTEISLRGRSNTEVVPEQALRDEAAQEQTLPDVRVSPFFPEGTTFTTAAEYKTLIDNIGLGTFVFIPGSQEDNNLRSVFTGSEKQIGKDIELALNGDKIRERNIFARSISDRLKFNMRLGAFYAQVKDPELRDNILILMSDLINYEG